jgi:hypothetical protein
MDADDIYFDAEDIRRRRKKKSNKAILFAHAVVTLARIEGMKAENMIRESNGDSLAYDEKDFAYEANELLKIMKT